MKFRRDAAANSEADATREEVREMAETLSLYRSAMHHIAEREAARPFASERRPARTARLGLFLAPALAAAVAAAVLTPLYSHFHRPASVPVPVVETAQKDAGNTLATIDDTALMNKIDSEVSEDVPDALQPLADLSDQTTSTSAVTEKKDVTQE
jgi:hypothetical protein